MANIDIQVEKVSPLNDHARYIAEQPTDRHTVEITDDNGSTFINAGIDSTCGKKRAEIVHTLTDDTINSTDTTDPESIPMTNIVGSLSHNQPVTK